MPLTLVNVGEECLVRKVGGQGETKKHLEDIGFTPGCVIRVISELGGNRIVQVKESRIAISREMAQKIMV